MQGRIFAARIQSNNDGDFLSCSVITNLVNGDNGVTVEFTNSNGLMKLYENGKLPVGREVTLTGHISDVTSTYIKDGQVFDLKRPCIRLRDANIFTGGLDRMPKDKQESAQSAPRRVPAAVGADSDTDANPPVDETPAVADYPTDGSAF